MKPRLPRPRSAGPFENHVSFEGDEASGVRKALHRLFENHVSFEGDEAGAGAYILADKFENHVSFEGDEADR